METESKLMTVACSRWERVFLCTRRTTHALSFNVYDGFTRPDKNGMELPNLKAARREAIRVAGGILEEDADRVSLGEVWFMEVTHDQGEVQFQLDFRVKETMVSTRTKSTKG